MVALKSKTTGQKVATSPLLSGPDTTQSREGVSVVSGVDPFWFGSSNPTQPLDGTAQAMVGWCSMSHTGGQVSLMSIS